MVRKFARTARERIRIGGGYRRDHLRALAQRVEVADREVRIIGSKSNLLQTLAATSGVKPAAPGVRSSVVKWRRGWIRNRMSSWLAVSLARVEATAGLPVQPRYGLDNHPDMDGLLIPGGIGTRREMHNKRLLDFVRALSSKTIRVSVCTGVWIYG
ncbi:MAG: hypothetical protein ACREFO_08795 [Acetobacteraceae bacterium]